VRVRSPEAGRLREALERDGIAATEASGALFAQGTTSERVGEIAAAAGIVLHELRLEQSSLEEVFLELTTEKPE
jgi:ABC-2 type transport system ATP-binding protein